MLKSAGRRIPMDVAVIGFDDQPTAAGQVPPLTSVHYPLFDAGVLAVETLLKRIARSEPAAGEEVRIPAWLAVRESCGCSPSYQVDRQGVRPRDARVNADIDQIAGAVQEVLEPGLGGRAPKDLSAECRELVASFLRGAERSDPEEFHRVLGEVLALEDPGEDHSDLWQSVVSILRLRTAAIIPAEQSTYAENLLHQARLTITDYAERQSLRRRLSVSEINHQIGWMTTRMFSAGSGREILRILAEHLAQIGIRYAQVALYEPRPGNPLGGINFYCNLWQTAGGEEADDLQALCIETADFPTPDILPAQTPYALALLPIVFQDEPMGFALFDAETLEPLATIIRQLAAALKTQELHVQAEELSLMDPSTGVQNRRFFELFLQREMDRSRRYRRGLSLMMINLDGWLKFTAAHGAAKSREELRSLAQCIMICVRRGSDVVCRYSGDTFAILLPETTLPGTQAIADTIRRNIEGQEMFRGLFDIGIGIAVAETESTSEDGAGLVAAANRALYRAKSSGRNQTDAVRLPASTSPDPPPDDPD
jgi:diguanylate cyclase (GGDEF)-like protein